MFLVDHRVTRDIPFPSHDLIPYWNAAIRLGYFVVFAWILSALRRAHDRERRLARHDGLTGIANRQAFAELTLGEIARSRDSGNPMSLAYIDCDNFKTVNDRFGHGAGDAVLRETALLLSARLGPAGAVARIGGDEFAVLLHATGAAQARALLERLHADLADLARRHGWPVTYSIGIATYLSPPADFESAIRASDRLMYQVKTAGKDGIAQAVFGTAADGAASRGHW